jgi:hypothetical protein
MSRHHHGSRRTPDMTQAALREYEVATRLLTELRERSIYHEADDWKEAMRRRFSSFEDMERSRDGDG